MTEKPGLEALTRRLIAFRDARDWKRFHTLKNLLVSLSLEAAEALELCQWKSDEEFEAAARRGGKLHDALRHECADVLLYLLLIAEAAGFDLAEAAAEKIDINESRYPAEKARGRADKYTAYQDDGPKA
jgi:NTP pyrophosphatase (non-canonical NTP hydrolase)